jgi:hypothetical protein
MQQTRSTATFRHSMCRATARHTGNTMPWVRERVWCVRMRVCACCSKPSSTSTATPGCHYRCSRFCLELSCQCCCHTLSLCLLTAIKITQQQHDENMHHKQRTLPMPGRHPTHKLPHGQHRGRTAHTATAVHQLPARLPDASALPPPPQAATTSKQKYIMANTQAPRGTCADCARTPTGTTENNNQNHKKNHQHPTPCQDKTATATTTHGQDTGKQAPTNRKATRSSSNHLEQRPQVDTIHDNTSSYLLLCQAVCLGCCCLDLLRRDALPPQRGNDVQPTQSHTHNSA